MKKRRKSECSAYLCTHFFLNQVCHCFVDAAVSERVQIDLCRCNVGMSERLGYQRDVDACMFQN